MEIHKTHIVSATFMHKIIEFGIHKRNYLSIQAYFTSYTNPTCQPFLGSATHTHTPFPRSEETFAEFISFNERTHILFVLHGCSDHTFSHFFCSFFVSVRSVEITIKDSSWFTLL